MSAAPRLPRRALLAAGAATPLLGGGWLEAAARIGAAAPVADAHTHLFNASDLPVANFVKHVILYRTLGGTRPRWARALIDFLAECQQVLAVSVAEERAALRDEGKAAAQALAPAGFGDKASALFAERMAATKDKAEGDEPSLAESYQALLEALAEDTGLPAPADTAKALAPTGAQSQAAMRGAARVVLERVAIKAESGDLPGGDTDAAPHDLEAPAAVGGCPSTDYNITLGAAARLIGWAYLLLSSRRRLIERYLRTYTTSARTPKLLVNHLVDYDYWIGDGPSRNSPHLGQATLAADLAGRFAARVRIATFAGFCPLRYAVESRKPGTPLFVEHQALVRDRKLAGFKLYPPMGFQASGNAALAQAGGGDTVFDPRQPGLRSPLAAWRALPDPGSLGVALDGALETLFTFCEASSLPVMAHAGLGNQLGRGFGDRANPLHWRPVAERHAIRISLGHLVNDAKAFVEAHDGGGSAACGWALQAPPALLDPTNTALRGQVYGDLAYMPVLIEGGGASEALCKRFFEVLRIVYGKNDPDLTRILYGTDWLMVGHERHNQRYLKAMVRGMEAAGYSDRQKENILWSNTQAFLDGKRP